MPSELTHRINDDEQNPATACGLEVLPTKVALAMVGDLPTCDRCLSVEIPTQHIINLKVYISTDVAPQAEGGLQKYLLDVGQAIVDAIPNDWFEPTEEYLHITHIQIKPEEE